MRRLHVLAVGVGALVLMVGLPAGTLWLLGHLHASSSGYALGVFLGVLAMIALLALLNRLTPDPFVLEVSVVLASGAGLAFAVWLLLR